MEEEQPQLIEGRDKTVQQLLSAAGSPAFAARDARVREAWQSVLRICRAQREEWLKMPRLQLGRLHALAGDWLALNTIAAADHIAQLEQMYYELQPRLRAPVERTSSKRALNDALRELRDGVERFNKKWRDFLVEVDLTRVNAERDKYNKYYVFEKECLLGSAILAKRGFQPLSPKTLTDLEAEFPLLPALT